MVMVSEVVSFLVVSVLFMTVAKATTYTVGDADGWSSGVDYKAWASGKSFKVGDIIVFKYTVYHEVRRVSEEDYNSCKTTRPIEYYKTGANATIVLTELGKAYFVCGAIGHCGLGMKVVIDTTGSPYSDDSPPPPAPRARVPPPPATTNSWAEKTSNSANGFSLAGSFALTLVFMMLAAI